MISFRKITKEDIPLIHAWFNEPHVQKFYSLRPWSEKEVLNKLLPMLENKKPLFGYIALLSEIPVGYLQYCHVKDFPWPDQDFHPAIVRAGAGLDFFIGDSTLIGKGLGPKIIESFLNTFIWPHFSFCVVDPDVLNSASVRMFEKCGFAAHKKINIKDALGRPVTAMLMIKQLFSVENVTNQTKQEMLNFLKRHEDYCLFLQSNFIEYGSKITHEPYSGNFKFLRREGNVVGVFCLTKCGSLLVQSEVQQPAFDIIFKACNEEGFPITGVVGEWDFCHRFWNFLKETKIIKKETFAAKEVLYTLDLADKAYPIDKRVRLLNPDDFQHWRPLNKEYMKDQGLKGNLTEEEVKARYLSRVKEKIIWGLFVDNQLTSVAELNAKTSDIGQVGGVYTSPSLRKKGLATALMQQIIRDVKSIHGIKKLIIFTDQNNTPARKVYESLGSKHVGHFALLFGN